MEHPQHTEGGPEAPGILGQILQGVGTGSQEQVVAGFRMRTNPAAQALGHRECYQEIIYRQQECGIVSEPLLGIESTALGTVPVVAGVVAEMPVVAVGAIVERTAQRGGAASQKALQHLALAGGIAAPN